MAQGHQGLPPVLGRRPRPRLLLLGSMPGAVSLAHARYYAHPRNAFWPILAQLLGAEADCPYHRRLAMVRRAGIALWDVLASCERRGSLDSAIVRGSERPNDIPALLATEPGIAAIGLNGGKAAQAFRRHILPVLPAERRASLELVQLPSTSPAHAAMGFEQKLAAWRPLVMRWRLGSPAGVIAAG